MADDEQTQDHLPAVQERPGNEIARASIKAGQIGGIETDNLLQMIEVAKLMSRSGPAVPSYLRENPGACLAVVIQASDWGMRAFAVANKSYVVENKGEIRVAFESQLIHAVIESQAPIKGRLKCDYEGDGDERRCIVSGTFKGEDEPRVFRSETLGKRRPGLNQYGNVKGSPLWATKPDLQQWYDASRDWARMYCPDILMGVYAKDEMEEFTPIGPDRAKDVSPSNSLIERLGATQRPAGGFDPVHIDKTLGKTIDAKADPEQKSPDGASLPQGASQAATTDPLPPSGDVVAADPSAAAVVAEVATGDGQAAATASSSPEPPAPPTDGVGYPDYVRATMPFLLDEAAVGVWWKAGKKLRNSLPNFAGAVEEEAVAIKDARIAELKG